ncbi:MULTISPECIES: helix-turn-helix transcriptional regulator [Kitasatospora]|uniref:helix-turn-helix transcriptional regulator n=1 Tax=Kitasatospora TaxID=2063 RepID=UPI000C7104B9|nr:helix-turn-helix transcriptional regulator [Kitasatospora sp. GP30]MDH6142735.1 transcriptional regulator with XRE-family HTH domain [Kitasatospora sp. GP30]
MTDRTELADFLSRCRARLAPADVGLPPGARRRTPGLRREEVAQLAGLSVDYYARLEQARGPQPSPQLLVALARALRLTEDERNHLFHLAGHEPPRTRRTLTHLQPALLLILDRLHDTPAQVVSKLGDVLAQNRMAIALLGDRSQLPPRERNVMWAWFTDPASRERFPAAEHEELARSHVANLRAVRAAQPDDAEAAELVDELLATSEEFAELWARHDVATRRSGRKTVLHPVVGPIEVDCEVLCGARDGQLLLVYTARPGSESAGRMELLRVLGSQQMTETPSR